MNSTRLPGKVLLEAVGKPFLELMIERVRRAPSIDEVIVATSTEPSDDCIAELSETLGVRSFRGSEHDVMSRVLGAARAHSADMIVELTGDCPAIDPAVIEYVINCWRASGADYTSNALTHTFPIGMDVQVFPTAILADAEVRTDNPDDREHVSRYIYRHPERYQIKLVTAPDGYNRNDLVLTLDEPADLTLLHTLFEELYPLNPRFNLQDIIDFLDTRPQLAANTRAIQRTVV